MHGSPMYGRAPRALAAGLPAPPVPDRAALLGELHSLPPEAGTDQLAFAARLATTDPEAVSELAECRGAHGTGSVSMTPGSPSPTIRLARTPCPAGRRVAGRLAGRLEGALKTAHGTRPPLDDHRTDHPGLAHAPPAQPTRPPPPVC